ncbi:MAG: hypothetical protein IT488_06215 [Gammaproteobacteria bacterium]|nr:hypothetical protein [Gammaproteobacteria bacterium]
MGMRIKTLTLTSGQILRELIVDALPQILGEDFSIVSADLPFDGSLMLCLDAKRHPALVAFDARDSGRALLAALRAVERLGDNRGMLFRLYPALFPDNGRHFPENELRLVLLAPEAPPGTAYLARAFPALSAYTFRILEIDGNLGLLVDPAATDTGRIEDGVPPETPCAPFRCGLDPGQALSAQEERHFADA